VHSLRLSVYGGAGDAAALYSGRLSFAGECSPVPLWDGRPRIRPSDHSLNLDAKEEALRRLLMNGAVALMVGTSASAAESSAFLGAWLISTSQTAPWVMPGQQLGQSDTYGLVGKRVVFTANRIDAPSPLACAGPRYEVKTYPPDGLFQGNLTDAAKQAGALGYSSQIMTLETNCPDIIDFHFVDANTAMFALDNRLYRIERAAR